MERRGRRSHVGAVLGVALWILASAAPGAGAAATVTVTPSTGLVDDQRVTVTASGLTPGVDVRILECVDGVLPPKAACGANAVPAVTDATGGITTAFAVDALLPVLDPDPPPWGTRSTVDCRSGGPCVLRVEEATTSTNLVATTPLSFDPNGALRPMPAPVVSSTTGLTDGQIVSVSGQGFGPRFVVPTQGEPYAEARVCRAGTDDFACTGLGFGQLSIDPAGNLQGLTQLRVLLNKKDPGDCRREVCELRIGTIGDDPFGVVRVPLSFLPDAPLRPPTLRVTPSAGLTEGATVQVHGETFAPLHLGLQQCTADPPSIGSCDRSQMEQGVATRPGASGTFDLGLVVRRVITPIDGGVPYDCAAAGNGCVLMAVNATDFEGLPRVPLAFASPAATAAPAAVPAFTG